MIYIYIVYIYTALINIIKFIYESMPVCYIYTRIYIAAA